MTSKMVHCVRVSQDIIHTVEYVHLDWGLEHLAIQIVLGHTSHHPSPLFLDQKQLMGIVVQ